MKTIVYTFAIMISMVGCLKEKFLESSIDEVSTKHAEQTVDVIFLIVVINQLTLHKQGRNHLSLFITK